MIIKKIDHTIPLPLYEVEEVSVEQALNLLSTRQKNVGDTGVSQVSERLRISEEVDEVQQLVERLVNIWGPIGARG